MIKVGANLSVGPDGTLDAVQTEYQLPTASNSVLGGVKVGTGLSISQGVLSANNPTPYTLPIATSSVRGGVKIGDNLSVSPDGTISGPTAYSLPTATDSVLGGIKIGAGLSISNGVVSVTGTTVTTDRLINGEFEAVLGGSGQLTVPGAIRKDGGLYLNSGGDGISSTVLVNGTAGSVVLRTDNGTSNKSLTFDIDGETSFPGRLNFADGSTYDGSTLTGAVDSDLALEVKHITTISAVAAPLSSMSEMRIDTSENDDITVVQPGWEFNAGTEIAPIWVNIIDSFPYDPNDYSIQLAELPEGFEFVTGQTYTFRYPTPVSKVWTINSQNGTLIAPGNAILSNETAAISNPFITYDISSPSRFNNVYWDQLDSVLYFSVATDTELPLEVVAYQLRDEIQTYGMINGRIIKFTTGSGETHTLTIPLYSNIQWNTSVPELGSVPGISWFVQGGVWGPNGAPQQITIIDITSFTYSDLDTTYRDFSIELPTPDGTNEKRWTFSNDGKLTLPSGAVIDASDFNVNILSSNYITLETLGPAQIEIGRYSPAGSVVIVGSANTPFNIDSTLIRYAGGIAQSQKDNTQCPPNVDTVIYTSTNSNRHAIKLFVMAEGVTDGGGLSWDTQACDIIAVKGFNNNIVHVTTYGVTYSGPTAIAEFDGQWNPTTNRIEITCRPISVTTSVVTSVHAIEMTTND
jgi:hypothetical protein